MTIINPTGISGITSLTSSTGTLSFFNSTGGVAQLNVGAGITISSGGISAAGLALTVGTINVGTFTTTSFASAADVLGVTTTGSTTSASTSVTLSGTNVTINNGDSVTGLGIPSGTTVASGAGTVNVVLSAPVGVTSSLNSLSFYPNTKPLSAGDVGGQLCRAWVNFNGKSATIVPRAAYNVSSITDNGTGDYTVTFTSALADANYSAVMTSNAPESGAQNFGLGPKATGYSTSGVRLLVESSNGTDVDADPINVAIFR